MTATPTPPPCGLAWRVSSTRRIGPSDNFLFGLVAISPNDLWTVGDQSLAPTGGATLIEHGDGSNWTPVPSANLITATNHILTDVDGVSSNDVWAVGLYESSTSYGTLTEHWDGTRWSIVPSPSVVSETNQLLGVATLSSNDAWAVGIHIVVSGSIGYARTLTEHWDGTQWSIVPSPNVPDQDQQDYLWSVDGVSSNDVWAVGDATDDQGRLITLIEHWDGTQWSIVPSPNPPGARQARLFDVAAIASDNVWAAGYACCTSGALIEHWDGSAWSIVPTPDFGPHLSGIKALSPNDIWAAGYGGSTPPAPVTLIEHWDGTQWSIVPSPSLGISNWLQAVAVVSPTDVWAAGYYWPFNGSPFAPLILHYSDPCATPAPTMTPIPITPTPTPALTATTTATATACPMNFSDVHEADYFYEPVRYLYCRGVISGYADGTFRPYNNTTRGQLTKIVVLGFGMPFYTPPTPTFQDVPPTHTFYQYIETAYHAGLVSGYTCGGPGEPCPGLYFRPGNNVTRGQLSKIVVLAAGWPLLDPPTATFRDVAVGSAFFQHVETAYARGIISGYTCGPSCLEFRPGSNATRGQICKIVYLAIVAP